MAPFKKADPAEAISIEVNIEKGQMDVYLLGTSPLLVNRASQKAQRQVLLPAPSKNRTELESTLKHDPLAEYQASAYRHREDNKPTRLVMPAEAFKKAISTACLRTPGATKTAVGQLVSVLGINVDIFGVPQMDMRPVRQANAARTLDIRTRAYIPEWCCKIHVQWIQPLIKPKDISKLLGAAGNFIGVGDGRPEKGALNFGMFQIVTEDDPRWHHIAKIGGRKAQDAALANPEFSNEDTRDLFTWYTGEMQRRSNLSADAPAKGKRGRGGTRGGGKRGNGAEKEMIARTAVEMERHGIEPI